MKIIGNINLSRCDVNYKNEYDKFDVLDALHKQNPQKYIDLQYLFNTLKEWVSEEELHKFLNSPSYKVYCYEQQKLAKQKQQMLHEQNTAREKKEKERQRYMSSLSTPPPTKIEYSIDEIYAGAEWLDTPSTVFAYFDNKKLPLFKTKMKTDLVLSYKQANDYFNELIEYTTTILPNEREDICFARYQLSSYKKEIVIKNV